MTHWNYRVLQDAGVFRIIEVFYDDEGNMGWTDNYESILIWDGYDDLKGTVEKLQDAFDKPILIADKNDILHEKVMQNG